VFGPSFRDANVANSAHRFDFRLEAFNIMNRPRLGNAVTNPSSGDFGYIVSKIGSRTMQVGMQYVFSRCRSGFTVQSSRFFVRGSEFIVQGSASWFA
jgi:hypothetical protein